MSGGPWVAALLVALAVAVMLLPPRRGPHARLEQRRRPPRPEAMPEVEIGLLLVEVASLLRAGSTPQAAWQRALGRIGITQGARPGEDGVPAALLSLEAGGSWHSWLSGLRGGTVALPPSRAARARRRACAAAVPGAVASCRLSARLGAPLAEILEAVADSVAEAGRAESSRSAALTGPRTTARLLSCLPPVGLVLGALVGADPASLLLDGGWGTALGLLGVGLMVVGNRLTSRLVRAATAPSGSVDEALVLDLAAASLRSGASLPGVLTALGQALEEEGLCVVGRALLLGAQWEEAWAAPEDARWRERRRRLEACLRPGWEDGASPDSLLVATAGALRAGRRAQDEEAAERLAVRLVLPLGGCYLPAFVILGIVPVVASVGLGMLAG
ncbi:type II secretion system F family protein [Actinomyces slackii]|uniref:Flp pilus assembly protein TadB n=1 Tax=Actinomyces slackii TaxID=52774 RepID=A0A448KB37_9ACTO|nr:hypothetical protein [Actinomyces slackii]VEG74121.1 Flp pilus assembly protein TadB [Actinomyces slackii]